MSIPLLGLNMAELRALARQLGEPVYRGNQLAEWVYRRGARRIEEMTNLPEALRTRLASEYRVGRSSTLTVQHSRDGTFKLLLELAGGARVEAVGLPYADRFSCCISAQVGCPIGCVFCATGQSGYVRDLTAGEMADQVLAVQEAARQPGRVDRRVDRVTFMGMGEPLLNYEPTLKALRLLNDELGIAMRHLTVSTAGYVPGIRRLAQERLQATLAVSLHAPDDGLRHRLVPGMTRWSVAEIVDACRYYIAQTGRRVTFEYCLLAGVNDGPAQAHALARRLLGLNCHVNLIPYNPAGGLSFHPAPPQRIRAFRELLEKAGIQVTQRLQRGPDIDAACGQLRRREAGTTAGEKS